MINKKIGFIGCGNMGKAMLYGILNKNFKEKEEIYVSVHSETSKENIKKEFDVNVEENNIEVAKKSDLIILAVKPYMYEKVIKEIKKYIDNNKIIISIAAGIQMDYLENWIGNNKKIIKTMPNTPALVGEGISAVCPNKNILEDDLKIVCDMFNVFGKYEILEEKDFHAFIGVCGSSPAYVYMFIEAMADAAVKHGIPRDKAYKLAAQSVLGSAKMVLETNLHPGVLKDNVCSPGGTTISAVSELENNSFRSTVIKAIDKCVEKSKSM